jgi:MFS family permease
MQLPLGAWLDKVKEKWFVVFAYFLTAAVFMGYVFVSSKWELFLLQIVFGVAIAIGDTAWDSMYGRNSEKNRSGRMWARYHALSGFATAVATIIGSVIIHFYGFTAVFVMGSIFAFAAGGVAALFLKNNNI